MEQVAFASTGRSMQEDRPLKGVQTAAQEKEGITISSPGDEIFKTRASLSGRLQSEGRRNVPIFKGMVPGPSIGDAYIPETVSDGMFQSFFAGFTEPAEIELVGKADRKRIVRGKGEGKWGEPCLGTLLIKAGLERVFYLYGIANKGRSLP